MFLNLSVVDLMTLQKIKGFPRLALCICIVFLFQIPVSAQHLFSALGTWEGRYLEKTEKDEINGTARLTLLRMDHEIIEASLELSGLSNKKPSVKFALRVSYKYTDGRLYLSFPGASTYYKSKQSCPGDVRLGLGINKNGRRILEGSFVSTAVSTEEHGSSFFELISMDDLSSGTSNTAGFVKHDVKYLDATETSDFSQGYAVIRKGENFAVIGKDGTLFIPFGKYKFNIAGQYVIDRQNCIFKNDMCMVRDVETEKAGFINLKGELVVACTLSNASAFLKDGYGWGVDKNKEGKDIQVYINKKGIKFLIRSPWWTGVSPTFLNFYPAPTENGWNKFYNKEGKFLFQTRKRTHKLFSEGIIRVDSTYEMIGDKIGFIDSTGRVVMPYRFKAYGAHMSPFSEGLALYRPAIKDEYWYVFLDKKGEAFLKIRPNEQFRHIQFTSSTESNEILFSKGFVWAYINNSEVAYMDKKGTFHFIKEFIKSQSNAFARKYDNYDVEFTPGRSTVNSDIVIFKSTYRQQVPHKFVTGGLDGGRVITIQKTQLLQGMGLYDLAGNFFLPPVFSSIGFIDETSGLAKANVVDPISKKIIADGYVDKTGAFVMILQNMSR